jgi:hypothetical protein
VKKSSSNAVRSRQAVTLNLSPRAVQTVSGVRQSTGITQMAFLERLLEWYAAQDPRVKTMILSPYRQVRQGLAKQIAEEMAANPERDFDSSSGFDELIDHEFARGPGTETVRAGKEPRTSSRAKRG